MKKRLISLLLLLTLALSATALTSCKDKGSDVMPEKDSVTRMTVDINPSVEFMIDDQNKIISVTALNDDGSILIAGEAFIGKTPEEATELVVKLATDTGYLVQGNVEADENTVKISVSGNSEYAEKLKNDITAKVDETVLSKAVRKVFDCRPSVIIRELNLTKTKYRPLAAYGHMGREDLPVQWEKTDRTEALKAAVRELS